MNKLYAISDLHLDYKINRDALKEMPCFSEDWLIIAGDICIHIEELKFALTILTRCFEKVVWVPGNHDLWTGIANVTEKGEEKYLQMVSVCRDFGVLTPEDPYIIWKGEGGNHYIVPLFLLYDYSFRPDNVSLENAVKWANDDGIMCTDEYLLDPIPYPSKNAWCQARLEYSQKRIGEISDDIPLILINHFPLRKDLVRLFKIPRFSIWCGTEKTKDWHICYKTSVVISGHLHMRATDYRDGVRFEEVSLGYPANWKQQNGIYKYLRQILPCTEKNDLKNAGPFWRF